MICMSQCAEIGIVKLNKTKVTSRLWVIKKRQEHVAPPPRNILVFGDMKRSKHTFLQLDKYDCFTSPHREAAKKVLFLVARPLRPSAPPPRLSGHRNFFPYIKKVLFSLVAQPFNPPLSGPATKKRTFFCGLPKFYSFNEYTIRRRYFHQNCTNSLN